MLYHVSIFVIILGLCVGSFLNVVTFRLPRGLSIVYPRSSCPKCGKKLDWYELIPVFSWIFICKTKCRGCYSNISPIYPFVEIITSTFFLLNLNSVPTSFNQYGENYIVFSGVILIIFLIPLIFIDLEYLILPDSIIYPGIIVGFLLRNLGLIQSDSFQVLLNLLITFTALFLIVVTVSFLNFISSNVFAKDSIGMGDAKLFLMNFVWLGISGLEISLVLSFLSAGLVSILGLIFKLFKRGQYIPFGPFISLSFFLVWLLGEDFWISTLKNLIWWRYL